MTVAPLRLDVALAGGVVEWPLTTEPTLLAAHVCKSRRARSSMLPKANLSPTEPGLPPESGVGAADPDGQATPEGGPEFDLADFVFAPRGLGSARSVMYVALVELVGEFWLFQHLP